MVFSGLKLFTILSIPCGRLDSFVPTNRSPHSVKVCSTGCDAVLTQLSRYGGRRLGTMDFRKSDMANAGLWLMSYCHLLIYNEFDTDCVHVGGKRFILQSFFYFIFTIFT